MMLMIFFFWVAEYAEISSKQLGIHLALSALASLQAKHVQATSQLLESEKKEFAPSLEALVVEAKALLPEGVELPDEDFDNAIGEACVQPFPLSFFSFLFLSLFPFYFILISFSFWFYVLCFRFVRYPIVPGVLGCFSFYYHLEFPY